MSSPKTIECSVEIRATPERVFDLLHDYKRRLEWDPFLSRAEVVGGGVAGPGVRTVCQARRALGGFAMETVYVSFDRPRVAAVKMTRGPVFLSEFAASIRQVLVAEGVTRVRYVFRLATRPGWARPLLDPLVNRVFERETRRRLRALKARLEHGDAGGV